MKKKPELSFNNKTTSENVKVVKNTAQNTIPFLELYDNGLVLLEKTKGKELYSMTFSFSDCEYSLLKENEKQKKIDIYKSVFNNLSPDVHYQETYINVPINKQVYLDIVSPQDKTIETEFDEVYYQNQENFINECSQHISDKKYYFSLSYVKKSNLDNPYNILRQAYQAISEKFSDLGVQCSIVEPVRLLEILHDIYNPFDENGFILPQNMYARGMHIRDYVAPSSFYFKHNYIAMGDCYNCVFYAKSYGDELDDEFLTDILNNNFKVIVSKHVDHIDKEQAIKQIVKRKRSLEADRQTRLAENKKKGTNYVPLDLVQEIASCNKLQRQIETSEEIFDVGYYISLSAKSKEELEDIKKIIVGRCREHFVRIQVVSFRQEDGLASIIPLGYDKLKLNQYFLSSSLGITIPFSYSKHFSSTGFYYGKNIKFGTPIILDRGDNKNGNAFILGLSGSGKSLAAKMEIMDVMKLRKKDKIFIIDPEKEFVNLCNELGGVVVKISESTTNCINIFDTEKEQFLQEDIMRHKFSLLISLFSIFKNEKLSAIEISLINRCIQLVYKEFIESNYDSKKIPVFKDYYNVLTQQPEQEARNLALYLEMYVFGTIKIFSNQTNIDLNNRLVVFDLSELSANFKKMGMFIVLDLIWKEVMKNHKNGIRTWLYADEFHLYYNDGENDDERNNPSEFFKDVFTRFRKYGGYATGITQNIEAVLASNNGKTMLKNSQFTILFEQAKPDLDVIADMYGLSDNQKLSLLSPKLGHGLIRSQNIIIPFEKVYPNKNIVFETISTTPVINN